MVQGGQTLVKYLLFFFNFLFVVTGIALIALGAVVKSKLTKYTTYLGSESSSIAVFLIVLGVIIFIIAFMGCCGAIKENYCMVMTFSVLLFIIFIMEFAAGIAAYVYRGNIHNLMVDSMNADIKANSSNFMDIQIELKCCGSLNYTDWEEKFNYTADNLPRSCCKDLAPELSCTDKTGSSLFRKGCVPTLEDQVSSNIVAIGGTGIGIAFVEVVGIIFACCLARAIKKEYETV